MDVALADELRSREVDRTACWVVKGTSTHLDNADGYWSIRIGGLMVGELLGGVLILIGITLLLIPGPISHRIERTGGTGLYPAGEGLLFGDRRKLLLVCSLLVVGGTALVLGGALA